MNKSILTNYSIDGGVWGDMSINFSGIATFTPELHQRMTAWINRSAEGGGVAFPDWSIEWMCLYCGTPQSYQRVNCSQCGAPRSHLGW